MSKPETKQSKTENKAGEEPVAEQAGDTPAAAAAEPAGDAPDEGAPGEEISEAAAEDGGAPEARDPEAEIADLNDRLLRSLAETENLRRRGRKEREETAKFAVAGLARDLLSVADNLGRALGALPENPDATDDGLGGFVEGVRLTERELATTLERHGIEKVEPMGEKFDPNLHEAMFEIPTGDAEPGTVVQVLEIGYVLNERLLRAAKVGVARPLPEKGEHVDTTV